MLAAPVPRLLGVAEQQLQRLVDVESPPRVLAQQPVDELVDMHGQLAAQSHGLLLGRDDLTD
eukprot:scaffold1272_cov250-Pinguiococcus_pyrenoidosus.AAC.61